FALDLEKETIRRAKVTNDATDATDTTDAESDDEDVDSLRATDKTLKEAIKKAREGVLKKLNK
ncbi:hypothetical protein BGX26_005376, partial [Mortierella sp. AD094]